jgi:hypothetical protein
VHGTRLPASLWWVVMLSLTTAGLAACSGAAAKPHSAQSAHSAAPVVSSPVASLGDARTQALRAYLEMWSAYVVASRTADYQSPSLARYAAGDALSVLTHGLYANYQNGVVTRGQPSFHPKVTVTSSSGVPVRASVTDCANSAHWADYYKSGKPAAGLPRGRNRIEAQLQPFDGVWKVTYLVVEKEGTC